MGGLLGVFTIFELSVCAAVTGLLLLAAHYMLLALLPSGKVHRLIAYALGVTAILFPFCILLVRHGLEDVVVGLWFVTVVGGLVVGGAWGLDGLVSRVLDVWLGYERERDVTDDEQAGA